MQGIAIQTGTDASSPTLLRRAEWWLLALALVMPLAVGCGINKSRLATEQLVIADAVDEAVAKVDFSPMSGKKVFLDTEYVDDLKMNPNGNVQYVVSSLRQQMIAYNCLLQEKKEEADIVVEVRLAVLAADGDEVTYGIPGNNAAIKTAASAMPTVGTLMPAIPDLSLGRRTHSIGAAKLGVFAYDRVTREPVWQAGISTGSSQARDLWVMGIGPFQKGRIYRRINDGEEIDRAISAINEDQSPAQSAYSEAIVFERALTDRPEVQQASAESPVKNAATHPAAPLSSTVKRGPPATTQQPAPIVSGNSSPTGLQGKSDRPIAGN
jgi:hypothetical protein